MTDTAAISLLSRVRHLAIPGYGDDEIRFIAETVGALRPTHIYEWGTNVGASARIFHEAAPKALVTTVEHPDDQTYDHPGHRYGLWCEGFDRIEMLWGDGVTVALERFDAHDGPERALFFLDGDHSYWAVTRELDAIAQAAPRGVILCHDTSHEIEDTEAAVEDFLDAYGHYDAIWLASQAGMARLWPRPQ